MKKLINAVAKWGVKKPFAACAVALLSGCISTTVRSYGDWGSPYIGTRIALSGAEQSATVWFDVLFEAILDTLLLPMDLICMPFVQ